MQSICKSVPEVDLHLKVGMEVYMECPVATRKKGRSVIRGWSSDYILIDSPKFNLPFPIATYSKAKWIVRYIRHGKIIGYTAKGLNFIPFLNLFALEYPREIEEHSLRGQTRARINIPVLVQANRNSEFGLRYNGVSVDISMGGIRIKMEEEMEFSDAYFITFHLPTGEIFKDVECLLTKTFIRGIDYQYGMKFVRLLEEQKKAIYSFFVQFSEVIETIVNAKN